MIIGLYGDSRAGKDTVARMITEYDNEFEWRSFATPLRQILLNIDPYLEELGCHLKAAVEVHGWDWVKKYSGHSVEMMISLGQSVRDLIHEDAWVWSVFTNVPEKMVISDVRQPNEYQAIVNAGGEVWKIIREGTKRRGMDGLLDDRDFPVVIFNNARPVDLERLVRWEVDNALQSRRP